MIPFERCVCAVLLAAVAAAGCGPQAAPQVSGAAPLAGYEQKMRALLRLEDERHLRAGGVDLVALLQDPEARVRRRAALALGRVRMAEGVAPLGALLSTEADPEVRQMAAFALGLIGHPSAADPLLAALADPDPIVHARAAEALGQVGHKPAATAIATMMSGHIAAGALNGLDADDMGYPKSAALEAVRLGAYALVRLGSYDALASSLLDSAGQPRTRWWPLAYAFQRVGDPKAAPVLLALLQGEGQLTRAFAARGLAALKEPRAAAPMLTIAGDAAEPQAVRIQAIRALAALGEARAGAVLTRIVTAPKVEANLQLEALTALGALRPAGSVDLLIDLASAPSPSIRAAALTGLMRADVDTFVTAISGLDPDPHWSVRAALATSVGEMGKARAEAPLTSMLRDGDQRVIPSVLAALAKVGASNAAAALHERLASDDPVVRAAAARGLAVVRPAGAAQALEIAVTRAASDGLYVARAAALEALAAVDPARAKPVLATALADKDWAVRLKAAELLRGIDAAADTSAMRPAPAPALPELAEVDLFVAPPYSPAAYIDTAKGTVQFELAVIDAPRTVANFIALARKGYFNGVSLHRVVPDFVVQDGDPRGDGEGGPGYTIRDEINQRPYLRGTVGMALDWADTGGSQFFITHSPQPHLDGRYTVFGQVVSGMDVVDRLSQWDTIVRIRVWDGVNWIGQ